MSNYYTVKDRARDIAEDRRERKANKIPLMDEIRSRALINKYERDADKMYRKGYRRMLKDRLSERYASAGVNPRGIAGRIGIGVNSRLGAAAHNSTAMLNKLAWMTGHKSIDEVW